MDDKRQQGRELARQLGAEAAGRGESTAWFEPLYQAADGDRERVPWSDNRPNPLLVEWLAGQAGGGRALVVGCGLGEDAEAVAAAGFDVTAFDLSPTAIAWCRRRWPGSAVRYQVADAADPRAEWRGALDLVIE